MNRPSAAMRALLAVAALGAGMVPGCQNAELDPPQPEPRRVYRHRGWPEPRPDPVPREPSPAELRAEEKRKRKAAKRLAEKMGK